jgi:hypothetical protein
MRLTRKRGRGVAVFAAFGDEGFAARMDALRGGVPVFAVFDDVMVEPTEAALVEREGGEWIAIVAVA